MEQFRSTGSYEPDHGLRRRDKINRCFDPQALTSLTTFLRADGNIVTGFDPQALTSLTAILTPPYQRIPVSIHRLLRA